MSKITLNDEFGIGWTRHQVPLYELLSFAPGGYTVLNSPASGGATQITVKNLPANAIYGGFVVVNPYTDKCEVRKATAISGQVITVSALSNTHSTDDPVLWIDKPFINARWFAIVGDGSADDTAALQRALNQVTSELNTVFVPPGTYKVSSQVNLLSNTQLQSSKNSAKLQMPAGAGFIMLNVQGKDNVTIEGLELDGNKANVTGNASGIQIHSSTNVIVRDCYVHDFTNVGILTSNGAYRIHIDSNVVIGNGASGRSSRMNIFINGSPGPVWVVNNYIADNLWGNGIMVSINGADMKGVFIIGNRVDNNDLIGIYVAGSASYTVFEAVVSHNVSSQNRDNILMAYCADSTCTGNDASRNKQDVNNGALNGDGIVLQNCLRVSCTGNAAKGNRARGINIEGSQYCSITGNVCYANNQAGIANLGGIDLYSVSKYNTVSGNTCCDAGGTPTQVYGIAENTGSGSPDFNLIENNTVLGNQTAGVKRVGSNTIIRNNLGFKTENAGNVVLTNPNTTVVISHGLNVTPSNYDFTVMFASNPGSAIILWVSNITSTQFTINVSASPGVDKTLLWKVSVL